MEAGLLLDWGGEKRRDEPKPLDDRNENSKLAFDVISAIFLIKLWEIFWAPILAPNIREKNDQTIARSN